MIEEKRKVVSELDIVNLCNKLSEPTRSYLLDTYVRLNFEDFSRVFFAYMTGYINGREEVTAMWKERHNAIAEIIDC
jgi:hypothetical protein